MKGKFEKSKPITGYEFAFQCECECDAKPIVRAGMLEGRQDRITGIPAGSRVISLCPRFFKEERERQVSILLHEGFHLARAIDFGYWHEDEEFTGWTDSLGNPIDLELGQLIRTADAYEEFVRCWLANQNRED